MEPERDEAVDPLFPGSYEPMWTTALADGFEMGATIDDGCLVVLSKDEWGYWSPSSHIPREVMARLGVVAEPLFAAYCRLQGGL